jgi:DNA-binding response OmpR family regulator
MSEPVAQLKTIVLNVNDSDDMRLAISAILQRAGFEVIEAATAHEALAQIERHEPHLVVLDVHLPDANGFEVCKRVRENPFLNTMRILHTSAMSVSLEDKIESLESGADGFLEQPFELDALISCVRSLLDVVPLPEHSTIRRRASPAVEKRTRTLRGMPPIKPN